MRITISTPRQNRTTSFRSQLKCPLLREAIMDAVECRSYLPPFRIEASFPSRLDCWQLTTSSWTLHRFLSAVHLLQDLPHPPHPKAAYVQYWPIRRAEAQPPSSLWLWRLRLCYDCVTAQLLLLPNLPFYTPPEMLILKKTHHILSTC